MFDQITHRTEQTTNKYIIHIHKLKYVTELSNWAQNENLVRCEHNLLLRVLDNRNLMKKIFFFLYLW